ncbi:unnamed protein product [Ectocarpus sp. 8 AP-2014]
MLNAVYCEELGLSLERGGELGDGGVFQGVRGESWLNRSRSYELDMDYSFAHTEWSRSIEEKYFEFCNIMWTAVIAGGAGRQTWSIRIHGLIGRGASRGNSATNIRYVRKYTLIGRGATSQTWITPQHTRNGRGAERKDISSFLILYAQLSVEDEGGNREVSLTTNWSFAEQRGRQLVKH